MSDARPRIAGASIAAATVLIIVSALNLGYGLYVLSQGGEASPAAFIGAVVGAAMAIIVLVLGRTQKDKDEA